MKTLILPFLLLTLPLRAQEFISVDTTYNGKKIESIVFKQNGKKVRVLEYSNKTGALYSDISYKNEKKHGTCYYFHANGNIWSTVQYVDDVISGKVSDHYENGQKKFEYLQSGGKRYGTIIYYTKEGGLFEGEFIDYDEKGKIKREATCIKGVPQGFSKSYSGGKLYSTAFYKNGLLDGEFKIYDLKTGKLALTWIYKDGNFIKEIKPTTVAPSKE